MQHATGKLMLVLTNCLYSIIALASEQTAESRVGAARVDVLPTVVVSADAGEVPGDYQQPRWASHGRFSSTTNVFVQDPWAAVVDIDYRLTNPIHGRARHLLTQEVEIGLPFRFQIAYENVVELYRERARVTGQNVEMRWAMADWGKVPLNPTFFAEYKIGVGEERNAEGDKESRGRGAEANDGEEPGVEIDKSGQSQQFRRTPDAFELRLLLAEEVGDRLQWALNVFFEEETGGDREVEIGFSQALSYQISNEVRGGLEMQFIARSNRETRSDPKCEFELGPSFSWDVSKRTRLDLAALFGTTEDSPQVQIFAIFSIDLGRKSETESSVPTSTRMR